MRCLRLMLLTMMLLLTFAVPKADADTHEVTLPDGETVMVNPTGADVVITLPNS